MKGYIQKIAVGVAGSCLLWSGVAFAADTTMMHSDTMMSSGTDLHLGSRGDGVVTLQTFLESHGFLTIPAGAAKGYFGSLTMAGLMKYQSSVGLHAAGYYGPLTRAAMLKTSMMKTDSMMMATSSDSMMH